MTFGSFDDLINKAQAPANYAEAERLIDSADVVFGVWYEGDTPQTGYIIKGRPLLQAIVNSGERPQVTMLSLLCSEYEEVVAYQQVFGDGRLH
jgi:hypothetical protein